MITNQMSPAIPAVGYAWVRNNRAEMSVVALMLGLSIAAAHVGDSVISRIGLARKRRARLRTPARA